MEHFYPRESRIPEIGMGSYHVILNSKRIPCCSTIPAMYVEEKKNRDSYLYKYSYFPFRGARTVW